MAVYIDDRELRLRAGISLDEHVALAWKHHVERCPPVPILAQDLVLYEDTSELRQLCTAFEVIGEECAKARKLGRELALAGIPFGDEKKLVSLPVFMEFADLTSSAVLSMAYRNVLPLFFARNGRLLLRIENLKNWLDDPVIELPIEPKGRVV